MNADSVESKKISHRDSRELFAGLQVGWLLAGMTGLQLVWLAGIWWTGATARLDKVAWLVVWTLAAGMAVFWLCRFDWMRVDGLPVGRRFWWGVTAVCLAVGVWYVLAQRVWPFDEEGMLAAAQVVAGDGGGALFENYAERPWLGNQHPPLGPLLFGGALAVSGDGLAAMRLVSLAFMLGLAGLAWALGRELFDEEVGRLSALLLLTFPLVWRLGTAAMVEVPLTFLATLALLLLIRWIRQPQRWHWPAILLIFGVGMLLKYTMIFVLPVLVLFVMLTRPKEQAVRWLAGLLAGLLVGLLAGWLLWARLPVLQAQWETLVFYAGQVLTQAYGRQLLLETVTNRLPSALGVYQLPLLAAGGWLAWRRRTQADRFLLGWTAVIWLPLLVTLPDHRYFMMTFPALAVLAANGLRRMVGAVRPSLLLAGLHLAGALVLFVDWQRAALVFIEWGSG